MLYSESRAKQMRKKRLIVASVLVLAVVAGLTAWLLLHKAPVSAPPAETTVTVPGSDQKSIEGVSGKYLFSGTIVPARAVENEARTASGIDYDQPFSKFGTFNPNQYDGWVADMECPITTQNIPYRQQVANTVFNCRPEFLPAISKYFTVLNLANNHVYDMGKDRFDETRNHVLDAGIQTLGNQDPSVTDDVCEVMSMGVRIKMKDGKTKQGTLPIAVCAWHYFEREPLPGEFDVASRYAEIMPVFGLMQVGTEYVAKADARQESVGREIIDHGADFVIGNSPHWVQNSDVYKDKLIFYSTGNFIFDQLDDETNRGASIAITMSVDYDENVAKWLALGESCKKHSDDCLQKAQTQGLKKIQPKYSYDLVASTTGYKQVTQKAPANVQASVEQRANWAQTLKALTE